MAKNYTIAEAAQIIAENRDNEALADLGKRYPLLTQKMTRVATKAGADFVDFMSFMPEYLSANKINSSIKKMLDEAPDAEDVDDVEEDTEEVEEKPAKKRGPKKGSKKAVKDEEEDDEDDAEEAGSYDYDSMNNAKLYKLLGELGKRKDCKEKYGDLSKSSMLKYLKKYGPKADASGEADDEDVEDDATDDGYEGKSAVELYKLCKQRKIKAEQKKPAKYYIGLLKKADEAAEEADAEDEEWDDEEEEAPKKPAKKAPAKAKKPAKKEEPEEADDEDESDDDDEEWDI